MGCRSRPQSHPPPGQETRPPRTPRRTGARLTCRRARRGAGRARPYREPAARRGWRARGRASAGSSASSRLAASRSSSGPSLPREKARAIWARSRATPRAEARRAGRAPRSRAASPRPHGSPPPAWPARQRAPALVVVPDPGSARPLAPGTRLRPRRRPGAVRGRPSAPAQPLRARRDPPPRGRDATLADRGPPRDRSLRPARDAPVGVPARMPPGRPPSARVDGGTAPGSRARSTRPARLASPRYL